MRLTVILATSFVLMSSLIFTGNPLRLKLSQNGIVKAEGRYFTRNNVRFRARGVNYYPKDATWKRFWLNYSAALYQIETELSLAKMLGINTVRIFLPYELFDGSDQSQSHFVNLEDFVNNRLQKHGLLAIVTLFDFYADRTDDRRKPYSSDEYMVSKNHIQAVISKLGPTNPNVLAWDIKNELDRDYRDFGKVTVKAWADEMIRYTRQLDPNHLITLGFYSVVTGTSCDGKQNTLVFDPAIAGEFVVSTDFVSMHYFLEEKCFESDLQKLLKVAGNKPILLEEFGLHTLAYPSDPCANPPSNPICDTPHTEEQQKAYFNALLSVSESYGLAGALFWTLTDFTDILDNTQESHHCQGVLRNQNVSRCSRRTPINYSVKPAGDALWHHFDDQVAYLDLFDCLVDPDSDEPPAGWEQKDGARMRGYNLTKPFWSHTSSKVALFQFIPQSPTSITGKAFSPRLVDVNIEQHPFLAGQIFNYDVRDKINGTNAVLRIGIKEVKDGAEIIRIVTVTRNSQFPYTFMVDLRRPPINWQGSHNFQIVFELEPEAGGNGYSATYELDWVTITSDTSRRLWLRPPLDRRNSR